MLQAGQSIAIFLNNATAYAHAMERFKTRVPAYIYLASDGDTPKSANGSKYRTRQSVVRLWQGVDLFFDGRSQETCRDLEHAGYGLSSISHMMETARIQGEDLFGAEIGLRLQTALELHSQYARGGRAPSWMCNGELRHTLLAVTEIGFNALANRLGRNMSRTEAYTLSMRPATSNWLFTAWETLTHANNTA